MKTLLKVGLAAAALSACITALVATADNTARTLYAVTDLGPGSAFKASNPDASGTFLVVGSTPDPDVTARATVWTISSGGTVEDVFSYDKGLGASQAIDVNDDGMIIGSSQFGPFVDVPGQGVKFLPEALQVEGVNNDGVVVGFILDPSGPDNVSGAVWRVDATGGISGPVLTDIGPEVTFMPLDINDEGTMSGFILGAGSIGAAIAEFDRNGELDVTDLGVMHPGDTGASAWSINSDGLVAGASSGNKGSSAFLWDPSQPNKLTSLGNGSTAPDINDSAQVVFSNFIWQNGKAIDLNSVVPPGMTGIVSIAYGINNPGHIVGVTPSQNAFVLTPQ